jgi:hypothetical protein
MKKRKGELQKSDDFIERFASGIIVGFSNEGMFVIDFLKPDLKLYEERGRIVGSESKLIPQTRIFLPPIVAKRLLYSLKGSVENYEKKYGKIGDAVITDDESK